MRVLITLVPDTSHLNPVVPLAWALQGAGHEVIIASHPDLIDEITTAGLTAVCLEGADAMPSLRSVADFIVEEDERSRLTEAVALPPSDSGPWEFFSYYIVATLRLLYPPRADPDTPQPLVDDLIGFAREWQPDVVLWDPIWLAGGVAAAASGALSARVMWGPDYCGWVHDRFAEREGGLPADIECPLVSSVRPMAQRHGLTIDERMLMGEWTIDQIPQEVRLETSQPKIEMRQVVSTGAGVVPGWLRTRSPRRRVAFTMGAAQRKYQKDDEQTIGRVLEALASLDVEVVATLDDSQLDGQRVPPNVRTFNYIPLNQLLPTCSAVIHHGGSGTCAVSTAHRVPQVVLAVDPEAAAHAERVTRRGAGVHIDPQTSSAEEIRARIQQVLEEPSYTKGAQALYGDWMAPPSPNSVVSRLEELVAQRSADAGPSRA